MISSEVVVERIDALGARLPGPMEGAASAVAVRELESDLPGRLTEAAAARAAECRKVLA